MKLKSRPPSPLRLPLTVLLSLVLAFCVAFAADDDKDAVFSTDVNVVNVLATVRDNSGRLINDLEKDAFILKENGKPQTIKYFSRQTDLPLTVGMLVDTSRSQARVIEQERTAGYQFFEHVLQEKDQAFVISFDSEVVLVQDLTNSKKLLERSLEGLQTPAPPRRRWARQNLQLPGPFPGGGYPRGGGRYPGGGQPPVGGPSGPVSLPQGGTALYDAVYLAAHEVLRDQAGRKTVVLVSDGVDYGSKLSIDEAIEAAQKADAIVFGIYFADDEGFGGRFGGPMRWGPDGEQVMRRMAEETGGQFYKLSKNLTLAQVFDRIQEELRSQYNVGYTPENSEASVGFRKISLKTTKGGMRVYTRVGYYPASKN